MNTETTTNATPDHGKTIEVTVYYTLSAEGQKAAVLAGRNAARKQQITGSIPADLLDMCQINQDGSVTADYTQEVGFDREGRITKYPYGGNHYQVAQDVPAQFAADLLTRLRDGIQARSAEVRAETDKELAEKAKRQEAQDRQCEEFLARLAAELDSDPDLIPRVNYPQGLYDRLRYWHESDHVLAVEIRRRQAVAKQRKEEQEQARAAVQKTALRAWIAEHGTPDQVERFDADLLPEKELKIVMGDWAFSALEDYQLYELITESEVKSCVEERYQFCEVEFRSIDPAELTAEQWAKLKDLRAAVLLQIPEITIEAKLHQGTLDTSEVRWGVVERMAARAVATVEGIEVVRNFAL